ncbi:MAG: hypothetical protein M1379_13590, partial [Firmicutes bacterium]|nr:hypothetical protein [Bacillota bacterium]
MTDKVRDQRGQSRKEQSRSHDEIQESRVALHKPELLAPVGEWEALVAAVENGADAVYLGGQLFNARR